MPESCELSSASHDFPDKITEQLPNVPQQSTQVLQQSREITNLFNNVAKLYP